MRLIAITLLMLGVASRIAAQDFHQLADSDSQQPGALGWTLDIPETLEASHADDVNWQSLLGNVERGPVASDLADAASFADDQGFTGLSDFIVRGQSPGGETPAHGTSGSGSGAAAAVNPSAPLSQLQFQNVFTPESYGGSGYANTFILQPVIAVNRHPDSYFPYHIIRPTFPILSPVSDPDGPLPDNPGIGDITYFDLYIHPIKKGVNYAIGPVIVFPTSSAPGNISGLRETGLGEWQLGPAFAYINAARFKDWTLGALFEAPISLESNAYSVTVQPIVTKLLPDEWFVGIGDLAWKFDDQDGNYNIPLSLQVGKVVKAGELPLKIFLQPEYTPAGLTSQSSSIYGVKLSVSVLLPGAVFGYDKDKAAQRHCGHCTHGCRHCY